MAEIRKKVIKILDSSFQGPSFGTGGSAPAEPEFIIWDRYYTSDKVQVFTDGKLYLVEHPATQAEKNIGILIESPAILPNPYAWVRENAHHFDVVLTFVQDLVELGKPFRFYALGGSWVPVDEWWVRHKTRDVSILASQKRGQEGHKLRHRAVNVEGIDAFGRAVNNWIDDKVDALREYRFSVVIENTRCNWYFTEKLIDCLSQGTIPVYWGCDLSPFFDMNGIITFEDIDELRAILPLLTPGLYDSKIDAVRRNFRAALQYKCPEDWICRKLPGVLR